MHYKMRKDGNLNDVILILQMKQGDEQAFDKFVHPLVSFARLK